MSEEFVDFKGDGTLEPEEDWDAELIGFEEDGSHAQTKKNKKNKKNSSGSKQDNGTVC